MHLSPLCRSAGWPVALPAGAAFAGLLLTQAALAQSTPAATPAILDTVTVRSTLLASPLESTPASVSVVDGAQMRRNQWQVNLSESLGQVPGLLLQNRNNYAQD